MILQWPTGLPSGHTRERSTCREGQARGQRTWESGWKVFLLIEVQTIMEEAFTATEGLTLAPMAMSQVSVTVPAMAGCGKVMLEAEPGRSEDQNMAFSGS